MEQFFGYVGALFLAVSGIPQAIKSIIDGHSRGVSHGTVWLWFWGEVFMTIYVLSTYSNDYKLLVNYILNCIIISIVLKYKYFERKKNDK
jgi:hypothetical protein